MSRWPDTNYSLIHRAGTTRDEAAWAELEAIYRPVIQRMALRAGLKNDAVEDLTQSVFLAVFRSLDRWQPRENGPRFRNWLGHVTRNAIINALSRRPQDEAAGGSEVLDLLHAVEDTANTQQVAAEARRGAIRAAAEMIRSEFSPQTWALFFQTAIEGLSVEQVATEWNCSIGAVYSGRSRVLARLRQKLHDLSDLWEDLP
jgi:RNA polymerase sigma-70 factor (ECF subfamily)